MWMRSELHADWRRTATAKPRWGHAIRRSRLASGAGSVDYDVVIAGGSFAGLAAAVQLRGRRVLLIEPDTIGEPQTSACGTLLEVLQATGTLESLAQTHDRFVLHLPRRTFIYPLPYPFCTFDYHTFCHLLLSQADVDTMRASVLGFQGHRVMTTRGAVSARILIDATGWRAALAANTRQRRQPRRGASFGLETEIGVLESGLHFYFDPRRMESRSVGWLFPAGPSSRAGVASYRGDTHLAGLLTGFVQGSFGYSPDGRHGGYFPYRRQPATTGPVFRVGDAAGQCLPLTGEGIRPALYFGAAAGSLARQVLAGERRELEAQRRYRQIVDRHAWAGRILLPAQELLPRLPVSWIAGIAHLLESRDLMDSILWRYRGAFAPETLACLWAHLPGQIVHATQSRCDIPLTR